MDLDHAGPAASSPRAWLRDASDVAWRSLAVALLVLAAGALLWKVRVVVLPVFVALLLCSALVPLVTRLEGRGWRPLLAAWTVLLGFFAVVGALVAVTIPPAAAQSDAIVEAAASGLDELETWLVEGPLHLERGRVTEVTENPGERMSEMLRGSSSTIVRGVRTAGEVLAGILLTVILTLLFLKDGRRFQGWVLAHVPPRHHDVTRAAGTRAFDALGGFLRGAAVLGVVEGAIVGGTMAIVGSPLWGPVAVLTFLAAFFPVVGAVVAGAVATLVTLATAGVADALIVLAVVVVVQQLDNDLLAPIIYGRSLSLHPAVILIVLPAGALLGGIAGAFLSVPLTAMVFGVAGELWFRHGRPWAEGSAAGDDDVTAAGSDLPASG
jgi:predicted PurR-regulated permease PerM